MEPSNEITIVSPLRNAQIVLYIAVIWGFSGAESTHLTLRYHIRLETGPIRCHHVPPKNAQLFKKCAVHK